MKTPKSLPKQSGWWILICLVLACGPKAAADDRLVGTWSLDEGFQVVEYTFRSDGRYRVDTRSTDPAFDLSSMDLGRYEVTGSTLTLTPYEFIGEPTGKAFGYRIDGPILALTRPEFSLIDEYRFVPGSREVVIAHERTERDLVGTWLREIPFFGVEEYTFRPGGYYFVESIREDVEFPSEFVRGRYALEGTRLVLRPYNGVEAVREVDFFGGTLAMIRQEELSGDARAFELMPGSRAVVRAKAAEAAAFLAAADWQVGVWEIRDPFLNVDLTFRPDGRFVAEHHTEFLNGTVRGRYALEPGRLLWSPFVGQDLYARSNGDFGKVEQTRDLDYYDGELQFIDPDSLSQSVRLARKRAGSEETVKAKVRQAQAERAQEGWQIGVWEVQDPQGWMQFTLRPDGRYIAKAGANGVPSQVERGQYGIGADKVTLAPYAGSGVARGFELDSYDGDLFLVGDLARLVVARKVAGSAAEVVTKTRNPSATKGELGGVLGLWTAGLPGQSTELVFRDDGEFRSERCTSSGATLDFGLYTVDMAARRLVLDSRFSPLQTLGMDFYGDTLTFHGGLGSPSTYVVNLGVADEAIAASHAADAERDLEDGTWLGRIPVRPKNPDAVHRPAGDIPADPFPGRTFPNPVVFEPYQLYRRLIPGFVYFNDLGTIKSVAVVNTREWHFFPTGRVLVRFRNYYAGAFYPSTRVEVSDSWGAYRIGGKPTETDVLRRYADNAVFVETDAGETVEMTLEDGRRHLFWEKDYLIQSEWAAEQKPVPCRLPDGADPGLMNNGLTLSTRIAPDPMPGTPPVLLGLTKTAAGLVLHGRIEAAGSVVVESTTDLRSTASWHAVQTNAVPAGAFSVPLSRDSNPVAYFRIRGL